MNYNQYKQCVQKNAQNVNNGPYVGYFSLKEGEEALVRILLDNTDDVEVYPVHWTPIDGRNTLVKCSREPNDPLQACPYCEEGKPVTYRIFLKVIQYITDEDGNIKPLAKIWNRPATYLDILADRIADYGPLSEVVCKVKRHGSGTSTTYDLLPQSPLKYTKEVFEIKTSAFDNFNIIGHSIVAAGGRNGNTQEDEVATNPYLRDEEPSISEIPQRRVFPSSTQPLATAGPSGEFDRPKRFY